MLKNSIAAAVVTAIFAGSAFAADLPSRKAPLLPPPPPPPLWTGFYVGLNAGYAWSNSDSVTLATAPASLSPALTAGAGSIAAAVGSTGRLPAKTDGFIGGGQVGHNYQFHSNFVAGIEADIQGVASGSSSGRSWSAVPVPPPGGATFWAVSGLQASKSLDYLGTVRGRLGWLVTPTLLVYGTGGLAYGGANVSTSISQYFGPPPSGVNPLFGGGSFSDTRVGWTAGGGLEWMFCPNWSAKAEYLYYDLGNVAVAGIPLVATDTAGAFFFANAAQATTRFDGHVVRAGVNYHFNLFNSPAPVVAKF